MSISRIEKTLVDWVAHRIEGLMGEVSERWWEVVELSTGLDLPVWVVRDVLMVHRPEKFQRRPPSAGKVDVREAFRLKRREKVQEAGEILESIRGLMLHGDMLSVPLIKDLLQEGHPGIEESDVFKCLNACSSIFEHQVVVRRGGGVWGLKDWMDEAISSYQGIEDVRTRMEEILRRRPTNAFTGGVKADVLRRLLKDEATDRCGRGAEAPPLDMIQRLLEEGEQFIPEVWTNRAETVTVWTLREDA